MAARTPGRWLGHFGWIAAAALTATAVPGCDEDFDPSSTLNSLRVLAVRADEPYPKPGTTVHLEMLWHDGKAPADAPRPVQILWIGGCFDPAGDLYYGCYPQFATLFAADGKPTPEGMKYVSTGNSFDLEIPSDVITRRPTVEGVEPYGVSFVFFLACAGTIRPLEDPAEDVLPLGCFDAEGKQLGEEDFVPGYLSLYSYDARTNANPILDGFAVGGTSYPEGASIPDTHIPGCGQGSCPKASVKALIDPASAEIDPGATDPDGRQLSEQMWVNYYTTAGKLTKAARLVNDALKGWNEDNGVELEPPAPGETFYVYTVVHDNRGGIAWAKRRVVTD